MNADQISQFVVCDILGIDVNQRYASQPHNLDERAREILGPADIYLEEEPTVAEVIKTLRPTRAGAINYLQTLFPSASWMRRYSLPWMLGDVIAGITISMVIVPQAMAYAVLAELPPAYGLYTSFTGAVLYWVFGTSKDIVIGATAVGSLLVGQVARRVMAETVYSSIDVAHALSFMTGAVLLFLGLCRLGWIIEFIPYIPISAFVTSAGITILSTQIPTALGIKGINTREAPYLVLLNTVKGLPKMHIDAAIGISSIILLFSIRGFCSMMEARQPNRKRVWSFISSLRMTFTMVLFTLISYLVHHNSSENETKFRILGHIDKGFKGAGVPYLNVDLLKHILPELPAVAMILVVEHIAISKAMGKLHNYTINPSQEIVALGAANLLSPFVGGYVCTGSFGASAVLSKAGVRTPLAGLFGATMLILALYALTGVFFFIPNAALAGLIIHAVVHLLSPPKILFGFWQLSPIELFIWVTGVSVAVFYSLEWSMYVGVILSILVLLLRLARTKGSFLGQVQVKRTTRGHKESKQGDVGQTDQVPTRTVFLPLDRRGATNPDVKSESPCPGVFIYRVNENFNYINQAYHMSELSNHIRENTKPTSGESFEKESDRLWNDPGPRIHTDREDKLPHLRAVVMDFAAVNSIDITSVQGLVELRDSFDRYAFPGAVEWHFANINNRWTRRALAVAGFGYPALQNAEGLKRWQPVYNVCPVDSMKSCSTRENYQALEAGLHEGLQQTSQEDLADRSSVDTKMDSQDAMSGASNQKMVSLSAVDRPFFHIDLHDAVMAAVADAQDKGRL